MTVIDMNVDIAEGFGAWRIAEDDELMTLVSSANIACGFHGGDPNHIRHACERAVANGVTIGAHVGYRDLAGFGRRYLDVASSDLVNDVLYQLSALSGLARVAGGAVQYVKPHGALYNTINHDEEQAAAVVEAVRLFDADLAVLGMAGSAWLRLADAAGLDTVTEAFADRAYTPEGRLVSRRESDALVIDPAAAAAQAVRFATEGAVTAADGSELEVNARSICIHSDTPGSLELTRATRAAFEAAGVAVKSFR